MTFSVKWVVNCDGIIRERIFTTDQFSYAADERAPGKPCNAATLGAYTVPRCGLVVIGNPHICADSMAFDCGIIYVMNDIGRTVATYRLEHAGQEILCSDISPVLPSGPPPSGDQHLVSKAA